MNENTTKKVKKHTAVRNWFQAAWFVITNGYLRGYTKGMIFTGNTKLLCLPGLNCYSCPGALGACPMGSLQAVMGDSTYRISLYVFGMLAAMGAFFGRLICGWMCPFGFFQDLLNKIPVRFKRKNLPGHKYLKYLKYVILIVFPILLVSIVTDLTGTSSPWFCEWICPSGMLLGGIPLVAVNESLRAAAGGRFIWKLAVLIVITLLSIVYYRPFCKYLCPLGAIYSLFNPVSTYRLVIDKDKCVSCASCQKACGMDIRTFETPNSFECIRCGSCMRACPTGAISSTWGQAGQKIKSRCIVDDEASAGPAMAAPEKLTRRTTFYGVVTIITGIISLLVTLFIGLSNSMTEYMTIDLYQKMNGLYIITGLLWTIGSAVLVITGIFSIRGRKDTGQLISIVEKARAALFFEILGLIVAIIGIAVDLGTGGIYFQLAVFSTTFIVGVPLAVALGSLLKKHAIRAQQGEETSGGHNTAWKILSVFYIINLFAVPLLVVALNQLSH